MRRLKCGRIFLKILDYLVKYRLDTVILSIIFSLILAYIYFKIHHLKSLDDLLEKKELEVVKSYEDKLNHLNTKLNIAKDEISNLKEQLLQAHRIEADLKEKNQELAYQLISKNSEVNALEIKNSIETLRLQVENFRNQQHIKTYEKE